MDICVSFLQSNMSYVITFSFLPYKTGPQPAIILKHNPPFKPFSLIFAVQMATGFKPLTFFLALLLICGFIFSTSTEARPYYGGLSLSSISKGTEKLLDGLYIEAIKNEGPSSGERRHMFPNMRTLVGIKDSGPSPGQGH